MEIYAIIGPDNKAINFIAWDGVSDYDYGQASGNKIIPVMGVSQYGFGWEWDGTQFINPNPETPQAT